MKRNCRLNFTFDFKRFFFLQRLFSILTFTVTFRSPERRCRRRRWLDRIEKCDAQTSSSSSSSLFSDQKTSLPFWREVSHEWPGIRSKKYSPEVNIHQIQIKTSSGRIQPFKKQFKQDSFNRTKMKNQSVVSKSMSTLTSTKERSVGWQSRSLLSRISWRKLGLN